MWKSKAVAFLLPPVLVIATALTVRHWNQPPPALSPQLAPAIPAPSGWIAFSGDVKVTHAGEDRAVLGRFYQSSDGSTRLETWPENHQFVGIVDIQNIAQATSYIGSGKKWNAAPMDIERPWVPMVRRVNELGLNKYPKKLDVGEGGTGSVQSDKGFEGYVRTDLRGTNTLLVPALNWYPVVRQNVAGRRETLTNIRIGPQPAELFLPPPDAKISKLDKSRGHVTHSTAESPESLHSPRS